MFGIPKVLTLVYRAAQFFAYRLKRMVAEIDIGGECQFKPGSREGNKCSRPAIRDGRCIFHAPKRTAVEKQSLSATELDAEIKLDEQFRQELSELLNRMEATPNDEPIDCRGFEFPEFTFDKNINKNILFTGATFHHEAKFSDITFQQGADFSRARFREGADFSHSTFEQNVSFSGVTFDERLIASADFTSTTFNGDADFSHANFHQPAYFGGATFGKDKNASFSYVKFKDVVNFQQTEFHGWAVFRAAFEQEANFSTAKFKRDVSFKESTFSKDKKTDFRSAEFSGADFTDITFPNQTDFSDTTYEHAATFTGVTFGEEANFRGSVFIQMVYFKYACFHKGADFSEVLFRHIADFSDATFAGKTRFVRSVRRAFFQGETDTVMDFLGEARFRRLTVEAGAEIVFDKVSLSQATFLDTNVEGFIFRDVQWFQPESLKKRWFRAALVRYIRHRRGAPAKFPAFHDEEDIRDRQQWLIKRYIRQLEAEIHAENRPEAVKAEPSRQTEEKAETSEEQKNADNTKKDSDENKTLIRAKTRLTIRDRALYRFRDIALRWSDPERSSNKGLSRENALWDEFYNVIDISEKDYEKIAENYRQLVLNYEKRREYDVAENFHFGEMHMRRRRKEASRKWWMPSRWVNGHSIYWLSSSYGTNYRRALLIFAIMFLLISIAFQYSGYQIIEPKSGTVVRTIEYDVLRKPSYQTASFRQWWADYSQSLMYTLTLVTFQNGDDYKPLDGLARLWLSVGTLALAGQAALFFLAIRRRFKR
jgi:uncharacterized protein YjbI with pentapeptide repeats